MTDADVRKALLVEAADIVTKDRNTTHGEPEDTFARIGLLWGSYLQMGISATDVANLMILMKVGRLSTNAAHRDSWVDIAGYAACGWSSAAKNVREP
jgi:Domain of unknown function (DUF6378)